MNKYFIGIVLIVIIVFLYIQNKKENMITIANLYSNSSADTDTQTNRYANKIENIKTGTRTYDDKLFDDVISYENDPNDSLNTGVYKCLTDCSGNCVEYGMTGLAYCFPPEKN
jgi:hypothetical protein